MVLLVVGGGDWLAGCRRSVGGYGYTPRGTGVEGGMEGKEGVGLDGSGLLLQRTPVTHSVFLRLCRSVKVGGLAPRRVLHFATRRWSVRPRR